MNTDADEVSDVGEEKNDHERLPEDIERKPQVVSVSLPLMTLSTLLLSGVCWSSSL